MSRFSRLVIGSLATLFLSVSTSFAVDANGGSPKAEMQATLDQVVDVAVNFKGDANKTKRREELRKIIAPKFDFREMAMRALGEHWRKVTEDQQNEFVDVFSDLLAKTYLERIETVERNMVKVESETINAPKAIVRTTVHNKGDVFPIDYKLLDKGGDWKVYDVVIENIGLISNYRSEFAGIIRKEKFDGLLKRLRDKSNS
jgi:phospholipid transport system substrate-binding protein